MAVAINVPVLDPAVAAAVREQASQDSWHSFLQYFSFAETCRLWEIFYEFVYFENDPATCRSCDAVQVVELWLHERWTPASVFCPTGRRMRLKPQQVWKVKREGNYPDDSEEASWQFRDVIRLTYHLQSQHLQTLVSGGFDEDEMNVFKDVFLRHEAGKGLFARKLFEPLGELGFKFRTLLEQQKVVDMIKNIEVDKNGSIDFTAFLCLLRRLYERQEAETRKREHSLIIRSGMALQECEDWLQVFQEKETETGGGIGMGDVKELFGEIRLCWSYSQSNLLTTWLHECDEDCSGHIDFGEFCVLVQRMWDTNFANIREKTAEALEAKKKPRRRRSGVNPELLVPNTWTAQLMVDVERQVKHLFSSARDSQELIADLEAVLQEPGREDQQAAPASDLAEEEAGKSDGGRN
eukprot:TRINITY_DN10613_c0_g1_i1.p1 TRINITY_DN10613_c0_g1~~TRINITY_DN10613_c0_g1_i1.p1  ORF type:complete len:409 (+),score=124.84 TRINITY_DN10613_c0_g1_i1:67-1293(+)